MATPILNPGDDFNTWWDAVNTAGRGTIAAGVHRGDDEWLLVHRQRNPTPVRVDAHGAIKSGNCVTFSQPEVILEGLTVQDSETGFRFIRGNVSVSSCIARNCNSGFAWTAHDTIKYVRVINSYYERLVATENTIGFHFDPRPDPRPDHNWINACVFDMCSARNNSRIGVFAEPDAWAMNYNTFVGLQVESNPETISIPSARENKFSGGHIVGPQATIGPLSVISGGRWVEGVNSPGSQIAVSTNSGFFTQLAKEKSREMNNEVKTEAIAPEPM